MNNQNWGETTFAFMLMILLWALVFAGEPDVSDALRIGLGKWAGIIPADYTIPGSQ